MRSARSSTTSQPPRRDGPPPGGGTFALPPFSTLPRRSSRVCDDVCRLRNYSSAVDFDLSSEQREIQAVAREFADAEIAPHASEWDREHRFPHELVP